MVSDKPGRKTLPALVVLASIIITACSNSSLDYFPLDENIEWEYRIKKQLNNDYSVGKSIIVQLDSIEVQGAMYYPFRNANGDTYYYSRTESGIFLSANPEIGGEKVLQYPPDVDSRWKRKTHITVLDSRHESFSGGESFISLDDDIILESRIASLDDVIQVPSGEFTNCIRIESKAAVTVQKRTRGIDKIIIEQSEWYAPGAGLVKSIRTEYSKPDKYKGEEITELLSLKRI